MGRKKNLTLNRDLIVKSAQSKLNVDFDTYKSWVKRLANMYFMDSDGNLFTLDDPAILFAGIVEARETLLASWHRLETLKDLMAFNATDEEISDFMENGNVQCKENV